MLNFDFKPGPEQVLDFFKVLLVMPKESSLLSLVSAGCKAFNLDPFPLFTIGTELYPLFLSLLSAPLTFTVCLCTYFLVPYLCLLCLILNLSFLQILAQYSLLQVIALFDKYFFLKHPYFTFLFV